MKILIFISLIPLVLLVSYTQANETDVYDGCNFKHDELGVIRVSLEPQYIDKFSSVEDAENHCERISQTRAHSQLDAVSIECNAVKEDSGYISTTMSGDFIDQFNSYEEAQQQCWKLHGYTETVESQNRDMIVVESIQSTGWFGGEGVTSQTLVHKDDVQQYYIDKQEEEIKRQNNTVATKSEANSHRYGCTASIEPAIRIYIFDAVTNQNISCKTKAIITDVEFRDELNNINCLVGWLQGGDEREGNYNINISAEGYETSELINIKVNKANCHINTKDLSVYLDPLNN